MRTTLPKIFFRRIIKPLDPEIIPPHQPANIIEEPLPNEPLEDRARRAAEKTGAILGGTIAGFTTGVTKHTIAPVTKQATDAARGALNFIQKILLFVFVAVLSVVGLLAVIIASAPRR